MLVRSNGLSDTMSRYLIRRIEDHPKITLHTCTELESVEGDHHLERVRWCDKIPASPARMKFAIFFS